jgi:ABC-2 type transport system permease protein
LQDALSSTNPDVAVTRQRVARVREDIDTLDKLTQQFQSINPLVLAAPFYAEAHNTAPVTPSFTSFYAPGVLVLLLQHIAITLAALSMVRERLLGTVELFRVSPVRPGEIIAGKYIGFTLLLAVVAGVLLLMMSNELSVGGVRLSLGVPILGDYFLLALTLFLVIFASIGLGFFISTISKSESQAVQLSMLVLLTSVFFSGFFLHLETIWPPVRAVSYALPVTYGISSLQVIMLRGGEPAWWLLAGLAGLGVFFFGLSFILFSRQFRRG